MPSIRPTLEAYLAWLGLAVQIGAAIGAASGVLRDPLYVLIAITGGCIVATWYCLATWMDRVEKTTEVLDTADNRMTTTYRRSKLSRTIATLLCIATFFVLATFLAKQGDRVFALVDMSDPAFTNAYHVTIEEDGENSEIAYSYMADNLESMTSKEAARFVQESEGVLFAAYKRPRVPWVQVTKLQVVVEKFEPSVTVLEMAGGLQDRDVNLFVAQIDDPKNSGTNKFPAELFFAGTRTLENMNGWFFNRTLLLADDKPEAFMLVLNARTPGVYTYRVEMETSYRSQTRVETIFRSRRCLFKNKNLPAPGDEDGATQKAPTGDEEIAEGGDSETSTSIDEEAPGT